jgi:hypothetical protein
MPAMVRSGGRIRFLSYKSCASQVTAVFRTAAFLCLDVIDRHFPIDIEVMFSETFPSTPCSRSPICYFSITVPSYTHSSTETPLCSPTYNPVQTPSDPENPLLAYRKSQELYGPTSPMPNTSSFLQMQTAAAHSNQASRPRPHPIQQDVLVTSNDSMASDDSSSSIDSTKSSIDLARCSRCQRTPSVDPKTGKSNMVQYGLNLWYCSRCASLVGLTNR